MYLKIWLDDVREAPTDYIRTHSVNETKQLVLKSLNQGIKTIYFDLDHDLGEYAGDGGDAIKLVDWLLENYYDKNMDFTFHIHSMNPVGADNMKRAIERYWEVI